MPRHLGNVHARWRLARLPAIGALAVLLGGCADIFFATVGTLDAGQNIEVSHNVVFDTAHDLSLDIYAPRRSTVATTPEIAADGRPVVVFFYGGSWEEGKRRWYRYVGNALAANGVIAIIPDYRKFPDVHFPAFMHDAAHAVAWTRTHAADFGGDAKRLFVMGHSAGGQIAALLAADKRYLGDVDMQPRDLAGMIGVAGAYAFLPFQDNEAEIFGDDAQGRFDSQPINFIDGDEPPMLLLQGKDDDDVPPNNAEVLAERAQAMDGTAALKLYPGVGHSSILLSFARGRSSHVPALADTLAFIADPLKMTQTHERELKEKDREPQPSK